jgi:hypothetical protein
VIVQPATSGRLGNQLHHYAYALELAQRHGGVVSYDRRPADSTVILAQGAAGPDEFVVGDLSGVAQIEGIYPDREPPADIAEAIRALVPASPVIEAVAIHVRRTDFEDCAWLNRLGADYYRRARETMRALVGPLPVRLFSDDVPAAARELQMYAHPMGSAVNDLMLMASHRHHIIANSTFSWWAQFLGRRPGQVVISPRAWFRGQPDPESFLVSQY